MPLPSKREPTEGEAEYAQTVLKDALKSVGIDLAVYIQWNRLGPRLAVKGTLSPIDGRHLANVLVGKNGLRCPPPGALPLDAGPADVLVGDYIQVDGRYHRVLDMRSTPGSIYRSGRTLLLEGYGQWVMTTVHQVNRPARRSTHP